MRTLFVCVFMLAAAQTGLRAERFRRDDPLQKEPAPRHVAKAAKRKLSDRYDFARHTFGRPGERNSPGRAIPALGVNTLGEPMDSAWYTKRHYWRRMSIEELKDGPPGHYPPAGGAWTVVAVKTEGVTPGFVIRDVNKRRYFVKFDPPGNPEMATAADVVCSKFFYALGYHVPDNYVVEFDAAQLRPNDGVVFVDARGRKRSLTRQDLLALLERVPRTAAGKYRAMASLALEGTPLGPFRYFGTRSDDPNDIFPHEHRRDLRGLAVFSAWLNHNDSRAVNTLDTLVEEDGVRYIRHHLIDFGSTLGSGAVRPNSPREGSEYLFAWAPAARQVFTLGFAAPGWARIRYPDHPSVGRFEARHFDPERWVPEYPNPAFLNRLPEDEFWAAKQVMAFTDEEIRAIVDTGGYSDPEAREYLAACLIARRDRIGRTLLEKVLPLDRFEVRDGALVFEDLGVKHGLVGRRPLAVAWSRFDNAGERHMAMPGDSGFVLPREVMTEPGYWAARIGNRVTVYLRGGGEGVQVVGVER